MTDARLRVKGLEEVLKPLRGMAAAKDINRDLRQFSKLIAADIVPLVERGVDASQAPQARDMSKTVRVHSDRVPVVVVGKVNPRFESGFRRRGQSAAEAKRRRGSLAAGVVKGGKGGQRSTAANEDYYAPQSRSETWGALGRMLRDNGPIIRRVEDAYLRFYAATLRRHGIKVQSKGR